MINWNLLGAPFIEDATELMLMIEPPSGIFAAAAFTIQNLLKSIYLVMKRSTFYAYIDLTLISQLLWKMSSEQSNMLP